MKNILKIIIPLVVISVLVYFGYGIYSKIQEKKATAERIEQIPDFTFATLESQDFTKNELTEGSTTIFLYFNSECEFCQEEAKGISDSVESFKNTQLLFISREAPDTIKKFADFYTLSTYDNIRFLHDQRGDFTRLFGATTIPYSLVYDVNQNLIEKFKGFVKVENLIKILP